ncbi:MAG: hypothetical protein JXB15_15870 [Anaerolineales bacterium]|nr:hypothetical protein [Anaerolineales bacterium]
MANNRNPQFSACSKLSLDAGEALIGTATPTQTYLLLEYNGAWEEKAFKQSAMPETVKNYLTQQTKTLPAAKLLLIKTRPSHQKAGVHFFIASTSEQSPGLYAFHLEKYEALLGIDIPAVLAGEPAYQPQRSDGSLLLVCTNGRRDVCCSREGIPVFNLLHQVAGSSALQVWQSSHVGGHRFAANVLWLPYGLLYGRVNTENALPILQACLNQQVYLPNLRGRNCFREAIQAADYYLRQQTGETNLQAFLFQDIQETLPGQWLIRFSEKNTGRTHPVIIRTEQSSSPVYESCQLDKSTFPVNYQALNP